MTRERFTFVAEEQAIQRGYFQRHFPDRAGHLGRPFQLRPEHRLDGLLPQAREAARRIFEALNIQWHTYIGHGRSSQACCLNFLMPMADKPGLLARWIGEMLEIPQPEILPVEGELVGDHRFVAFEYTGPDGRDFLGEAGGATPRRGAHATASDAAIGFISSDGSRELLLIEWKYSEEYRHHRLSLDKTGKRHRLYAHLTFAPDGPIRSDLGLTFEDFLFEPLYQLLRQQALAWQIERNSDYDRVRVLHFSPSGNRALHQVTSPAFRTLGGVSQTDVFAAFRTSLVDPDAFLERSIEQAFAPLADWPEIDWYPALAERYPSLCPGASA